MIEYEKKKVPSLVVALGFALIACILYGVTGGIRGNIGILLNPLAEQCGLEYSDVSICIAVMQLFFGATQPVFGIIAKKKSNRYVLMIGAVLIGISILGMLVSRDFLMLVISLGFIFGTGTGAISFGLVFTSAVNLVGQDRAMMLSGMLNASAGMGAFIFAPIMQGVLDIGGSSLILAVLLIPTIALIPLSIIVTKNDESKGLWNFKKKISSMPKANTRVSQCVDEEDVASESVRELFRRAFQNRTYRLLVAGFSTCGFHMVLIEAHLFSQYVGYGISKTAASWAFSLYGVSTILGALLSGWASTRFNKGNLLGFYYGFRAAWTLLYLFIAPKNIWTAFIFSTGLGLTGDATVSPTSGLVNTNFKTKDVAILLGFLFLVHQIGAFISSWLGGILVEMTGSYNPIWLIDVCTCTFASIMSLRISRGKRHE